jgi:hypothetical protein
MEPTPTSRLTLRDGIIWTLAAFSAATLLMTFAVSSARAEGWDENPHVRIENAMAQLPFTIDFQIGDCAASVEANLLRTVRGCYRSGADHIVITEDGLDLNQCGLRVLIAHEYRHYHQWTAGQFQVDGAGTLVNRDDLEADARAWADTFRC